MLAAVIEAALGAIFLQHGFAAIEDAVVDAFAEQIEHALTSHVDHKTDLQEPLARSGSQVTYAEISVEGPAARAPLHVRRDHRRRGARARRGPDEEGRRAGSRPGGARQARFAGRFLVSGILPGLMAERKPTNSELRLRRLTEEELDPEPRGILEIFAEDEQADEDAPLARDDASTTASSVLPPL